MRGRNGHLGAGPILAALLLVPSAVGAQSLPLDDFSANRFYVAPGPSNFILVESPEVGRDMMPSFGATLGYAHRPYAADDLDCVTGTTDVGCNDGTIEETDLLSALLTLNLHGSFTFLERIQIGLVLPVLLFFDGEGYEYIEMSGGRSLSSRTAAFGGPAGGLGDPRLSAKVRILDPDHAGNGVTLGASAFVTAPIGHAMWDRRFVGDRLPTGGISALGGFRLDAFRLALNVGLTLREEQTSLRSAVGPEATWGVAAAYRIDMFEAMLEATGATSFGQRFDSEAPTEARVAGLVHLGETIIRVGAGLGLVYGVGVPVFHVFGGVTYAPEPARDTDGDGLNDEIDGCPADREDVDGFDDEDGCPELDNDDDRIPDADDTCPEQAEDVDGWEDEDGCPDEDDDGDGIRDGYDSCPREPEDRDGDHDEDGCPDHDADGDGIPSPGDQCPDAAEDFDGFGDEDGCPEEDFDGDGLADAEDDCPDAPGEASARGCPETPTE